MMIQTKRLTLKPLGIEYLASVNKYATNFENTKWMVFLPKESIEETEQFLVNCDKEWKKVSPLFWEFAILLSDIHIGAVSIYFNEDYISGELGWIIDKKYWGNGYAYEAAKAVIDVCKKKRNMKKFIAHCDSENRASIRVMEKLGMKIIGKYTGRKNRASDEVREEYEFLIEY